MIGLQVGLVLLIAAVLSVAWNALLKPTIMRWQVQGDKVAQVKCQKDGRTIIEVKIQGVLVKALIDTGCSMTCIAPTLVERAGLAECGTAIVGGLIAEGYEAKEYRINIEMLGYSAETSALGTPIGSDKIWGAEVILGCDILKYCQMIYNGPIQMCAIKLAV